MALVERPAGVPADKWQGPYIENLGALVDPWENVYRYAWPAMLDQPYYLWSPGPDGRSGTEDDIRNWEWDDADSPSRQRRRRASSRRSEQRPWGTAAGS